jgi:ribonucleoside-diphosphate reductase alpha chain
MLSIHINHPDSLDFIKIKRDLSQVTGANISVKISEEFMKAVENDEDYILRFPCDKPISKDFFTPKQYGELMTDGNGFYWKLIKAKEYWNEIIKSAHGSAEPGIIFEDNHHNYSPDGVYPQFKGITTNPCGEIFMQEYDACRLIAVNLFSFVENPFTDVAYFNYIKFSRYNYEAMRLSDDLIDLELEHIDKILRKIVEDPEPFEDKRTEFELWTKIKETAAASRRTGLGFTALGDALAALGLKYDSDKGLEVIKEIMRTKLESELDCTIDLAILRGTFERWDTNKEFYQTQGRNTFYKMLMDEFPEHSLRMIKYGRRNVSWSTVAPTGTVSIMSASTSGIEPLFSPYYFRRKKINPNDEGVRVDFTDQNGDKWQEFPVLHPKFKDWIETTADFKEQFEASLITKVEDFNKATLESLFELSPYYKSTANDIDWVKRVEIQGIIQKYITHSISSTINLPNSVTEAEVGEIYIESWKKGLKGITVYRDGSRSGVLITESTKDKPTFEYKDAVKRPRELDADVHHVTIKGVAYKILVGLLDDKPYEVFFDESENKISGRGIIFKKKRGNYFFKKDDITTDITSAMSDEQVAISRLVSTSLRHGASIHFITEQLLKCDGDIFSFTKSLARVLKKYIPEGVKSTVTCNDCGSSNVIFQEGCQTCQDCGNSRCG